MITDKDMEEAREIIQAERDDQGFSINGIALRISRIRAESAKQATKEARELIKEMREEINITLRDFEKIDEVCRMANAMPFSLTKRKLAELLERTKGYAE